MNGWIVPPYQAASKYPPCVMLLYPDDDSKRCGKPAEGGHTVLDCAICEECYDLCR
jgi:hypothetical protein